MSADLDTTRINRDVQKYVEEIIQHLTSVDGARLRYHLKFKQSLTKDSPNKLCGLYPRIAAHCGCEIQDLRNKSNCFTGGQFNGI
jgi:hypothetical protein